MKYFLIIISLVSLFVFSSDGDLGKEGFHVFCFKDSEKNSVIKVQENHMTFYNNTLKSCSDRPKMADLRALSKVTFLDGVNNPNGRMKIEMFEFDMEPMIIELSTLSDEEKSQYSTKAPKIEHVYKYYKNL